MAAERRRQLRDQFGSAQGRGIDADLVGASGQDGAGNVDAVDPARHAERNVEHRGHPLDPARVEASTVGAGGDVVEHQLVRAGVAIALGMVEHVADVAMIAKADALDHAAVGDVEAGDYPNRRHDRPLRRR